MHRSDIVMVVAIAVLPAVAFRLQVLSWSGMYSSLRQVVCMALVLRSVGPARWIPCSVRLNGCWAAVLTVHIC